MSIKISDVDVSFQAVMGIQLVITLIVATLLHKVIPYISPAQFSIRGCGCLCVCVCVGCTCECLHSDFQFEEV